MSAVARPSGTALEAAIQLDCSPSTRTQKSISRQTERATTNPRPRTGISWKGEPRSAGYLLCVVHFDLFFQNNFPNNTRTKKTWKNRIHLVKPSCAEDAGPSGMPRFVENGALWDHQKSHLESNLSQLNCWTPVGQGRAWPTLDQQNVGKVLVKVLVTILMWAKCWSHSC